MVRFLVNNKKQVEKKYSEHVENITQIENIIETS